MNAEKKHRRSAAMRWNELVPPPALEAANKAMEEITEQSNLEFGRHRRPGRVPQHRGRGHNECDAASENGGHRERVLHNEERHRSGEQQRQIRDDQLQSAVLVFDV